MQAGLADPLHLLELERIEDNIFRGESRDIGSPRVFGGQVLGQALTAASYTVEGRDVHSLHAYFLRAGDVDAHIVYDVDRARDGRSFSNRRVVAIQHGRPIFNITASFQIPEQGIEHQATMPHVAGPDELADISEILDGIPAGISDRMRRYVRHERPFEIRPVDPVPLLMPQTSDPVARLWLRASGHAARGPGPAPQPARLSVGLRARRDGDAPTRDPLHAGQCTTGEPRPRDVVSPAVPCRRVVALCDGEPERGRCPRARVRAILLPRRRTGRVDGSGRDSSGSGTELGAAMLPLAGPASHSSG